MSNVTGRMVNNSVYGFYTLGAIGTPAATAYEPTLGMVWGCIVGIGAVVGYITSYTLTIRIPTEDEMKEWLDEQRD